MKYNYNLGADNGNVVSVANNSDTTSLSVLQL